MILNRREFIDYINETWPNAMDHDHAIWIPERTRSIHCEYFLKIKSIYSDVGDELLTIWLRENLNGKACCLSSGFMDWWGFTDSNDIFLFVLRWS